LALFSFSGFQTEQENDGIGYSFGKYEKLVGFGRACAPVRCAHASFLAYCHAKRGAARLPVNRSFAAFSSPPKNNYFQKQNAFPQTRTWAGRSVLEHRAFKIQYFPPLPPPKAPF
jgi:hypothetical protein